MPPGWVTVIEFDELNVFIYELLPEGLRHQIQVIPDGGFAFRVRTTELEQELPLTEYVDDGVDGYPSMLMLT